MNIWLLEVGEYSDARVVAAFDDEHKADAEQYAELVGGRVIDEPVVLNAFSCDAAPAGEFWRVEMTRHGKVVDARTGSLLGDGQFWTGPPMMSSLGKLRQSTYRVACVETNKYVSRHRWRLTVEAYARNETHAVKIANEIRSRVLAGALPLTYNATDIDEGLLSALRELREEA